MEQNTQVLSSAYNKARHKLKRIAELKITHDMSEDAIDKIVMDLSLAKALEAQKDVKHFIKGQQWYVESLVDFSGMTADERLDTEYEDCFGETASREDMLAKLA